MPPASFMLFRAVTLAEGDRLDTGARPARRAGSQGGPRTAAERAVLASLYPRHPSSRKLARRLGLSHTQIAAKPKACGIQAR